MTGDACQQLGILGELRRVDESKAGGSVIVPGYHEGRDFDNLATAATCGRVHDGSVRFGAYRELTGR